MLLQGKTFLSIEQEVNNLHAQPQEKVKVNILSITLFLQRIHRKRIEKQFLMNLLFISQLTNLYLLNLSFLSQLTDLLFIYTVGFVFEAMQQDEKFKNQ